MLLENGGLARLTDRTVTSIARLERQLAAIDHDGYAVSIEEFEDGLNAVAAPIRDSTGEVVAALSVSGPSTVSRRSARDRSPPTWCRPPTSSAGGWASRARTPHRIAELLGLQGRARAATLRGVVAGPAPIEVAKPLRGIQTKKREVLVDTAGAVIGGCAPLVAWTTEPRCTPPKRRKRSQQQRRPLSVLN